MLKKIIVLWGCSASGKTVLADYLASRGIPKIKTTTTRKKRNGKENDYNFVTVDQFKELNTFAGTKFAGNYYGSDLKYVKNQLKKHNCLVIILTWSGVVNYIKEFQGSNIQVFPIELYCPISVIYKRFQKRQTSSKEIRNRIQSYCSQVETAKKSSINSYVINNYNQLPIKVNLANEYKQINNILN